MRIHILFLSRSASDSGSLLSVSSSFTTVSTSVTSEIGAAAEVEAASFFTFFLAAGAVVDDSSLFTESVSKPNASLAFLRAALDGSFGFLSNVFFTSTLRPRPAF